jgi:hypothetical protein
MTKKTRQRLEALLRVTAKHVEVRNTSDSLDEWVASISVEIKDGGILISVCGRGDTPDKAVENMLSKVCDKILVTDAYTINRREIFFRF